MHLSEVERLTQDYSETDVNEISAVAQSTLLSTPSSTLRWTNVQPQDAETWLRNSYTKNLKREFELDRISDFYNDQDGDNNNINAPSTPLAEHLVIRDLDMPRLDDGTRSPGRIVAHADYRYHPSYGANLPESHHESEENSINPSTAWPPNFQKSLQLHLNSKVESTLTTLFAGLPCFELHGISTLTPSHLRRGIATKLTGWVFPVADRWGLPVVLCASPVGVEMYKKCGFVEYRSFDVVVGLEGWGGVGEHRHVVMVRWPGVVEGERRVVVSEEWMGWKRKYGGGM